MLRGLFHVQQERGELTFSLLYLPLAAVATAKTFTENPGAKPTNRQATLANVSFLSRAIGSSLSSAIYA
jgi:hypothetical protein